jgi:SAM-dependent methyltransferase
MANEPARSPKPESLDEIVSQSAIKLAEQIQTAAGWAKSETDLQVEVAAALRDFARRAQIELKGHQNVTVGTGRQDSVYGSVIVEYKAPGVLSPNKEAAPNKAVIEQLKRYFYDTRREQNKNWNSMFGVGTDGKYFIFLRFRDDKWTDQEPLPVDRYSTERFLWALYNLGQKGKPYQPEYLHGDFGSDSQTAQEGVRALYEEILTTTNPKAQVFFSQWKILFGEVCGYDVENLSDKLKKLAEFYGVKGKTQPAQLLFAVHTYYAILIKLLASEIVSFFNPWMTRQVEKLQGATTPAKLKRELEALEQGGVFHTLGITNFLEGDLFAWYLAAWTEPIEKLVRKMITKLDEYNPGTFSEEPAQSRDLLKKLYQQLFPKSVRHDLGEYYTPDWLAEHVLNELGYVGDPDKRILDPACGSGTFLVMAINRIRRWYDLNREKCAYDQGELLKKILTNVIGFDLNPLAVMAARTNYLVAIKDLIRHVDGVEIPVYLCDSIMTPAEYGDLFTGGTLGGVAKVPCSAMKPPHLLVPKEIATSPKEVAKYAEVMEQCVKNGYAPKEFLSRCRDEGLDISATDAHIDLYKELVKLDKANKNGIWARIIKNNFAPLFVGRVDYVAGNPPWVNWDALPNDYRRETFKVWQAYNLFSHKGLRARLGSSEDDISVLMTYVSADKYLKAGGELGFVITQSVFQSKGGGVGFRRFRLSEKRPLRIQKVHDMVTLQPFEEASNRTSVFTCETGRLTTYPVPYVVWARRSSAAFDSSSDLADVLRSTTRTTRQAVPVDRDDLTSPWLVTEKGMDRGLSRVLGKSPYQARVGVHTVGANGVFWVTLLGDGQRGAVIVENCGDIGKRKVEIATVPIESELLYPLVRGREVQRWSSESSLHIILPQYPEKPSASMSETALRKSYPKGYEYLMKHRHELRQRKSNIIRQLMESGPVYSLYAIGPYTYSRFKVVWKEIARGMQAAVVKPISSPLIGTRPAIPDHKLTFVDCSDDGEAHYLCAVMNSAIVSYIVTSYVVSTQISTHVLDHVAVPKYSPSEAVHRNLAELSIKCHAAAAKDDGGGIATIEADIDRAAAKLWSITKDELRAIREALPETGRGRRELSRADDD